MEKKTVIIEVQTAEGVQNLDRLSAKFDEIYGEVLPLTGAIGELEDQLYEMAKAGQQNTDEFKAVAAEAGRLKKVIAQVDMEVDALSMTATNKLGGALGGAASGFELVQGAMGAIGVESQAVEEALLKVQSAMAISQGIQGVKESIPAFKALGAAVKSTAVGQVLLNGAQIAGAAAMSVLNAIMAANPILLIVSGIAALSGALMFFTRDTGNAKQAAEDFTKSLDNQRKAIDSNFEALEKRQQERLKLMEAQGASEKELFDKQQQYTKELAKSKQEAHNKEKYSYQNLRLLYKQLMDQGEEEEAAKIREQLKASRERYNELGKQSKDYYHQLSVDNALFLAENKKKVEENAKKVEENAKAVREKQAEEAKAAAEKKEALWQEEYQKSIERKKEEREIEQYWIDETERLRQEEAAKAKAVEEQKTKWAEEEAEARATIYAIETQKALEEDAKKEEGRKLLEKEKYQMAYNSLQLISDMADLFADADEKKARAAFNVKKAASIASATINTIESTIAAFKTAADSPITTVFPAYPFVQAGLAAGFGAAKIAAIGKQRFEGGGGASGGASGGGGGSTPAMAMSSPASFNVVGNSGTNQLMEGLSNSPVKAYVVSGDVTSAQSLDRNKRQTASL